MITIRNDFHNTEVRIRANIGEELTWSQIMRARRKLCGIAGCTCGGPCGERGPQDGFYLEQLDYDRVAVREGRK